MVSCSVMNRGGGEFALLVVGMEFSFFFEVLTMHLKHFYHLCLCYRVRLGLSSQAAVQSGSLVSVGSESGAF